MADEEEYEAALRNAERELTAAESAAGVRRIWRTYLGTLGHRTLGRLLLGRSAQELLSRRVDRGGGGGDS